MQIPLQLNKKRRPLLKIFNQGKYEGHISIVVQLHFHSFKLWFPRAAAMQYSERAMTVNDVTKTLPQLTKERGCLESVGR